MASKPIFRAPKRVLETRKYSSPALVIVLAACFLLSGCSESTKPKPPSGECANCLVPRTSPANVLEDLRVIYSVMDNDVNTANDAHALASMYRTLFHPDFRFYFVDGQQPPEFADANWWGRDSSGVGLMGEVPAFDTLMTYKAAGFVSDVRISWTPGSAVPDNRMGDGGLLHPGWKWIHVNSILLEVQANTTLYMVPNCEADFYFAADPADTTLWVITEWWDLGSSYSPPRSSRSFFTAPGSSTSPSASAVPPFTWGQIKIMYR